MTVAELRKKLDGIAPETEVVIYREADQETNFYGLVDAAAHSGMPIRHQSGHPGLRFENQGPVTWFLLMAEEA